MISICGYLLWVKMFHYKILCLGLLILLQILILRSKNILAYSIGFGASGSVSWSDGNGLGKNITIFRANMSSSVHNDNKKKYLDPW